MTHNLEFAASTVTIARRMRDLRDRRGWSGQRLAEELAKVGVRWDRNVVANLENGRRASVSVEELLALAYVLDVAPVHLLVPTDSDSWYAFTPHMAAPSAVVREWVRGRYWMPRTGGSDRTYFTEVPNEEWEPPRPLPEEERDRRRVERLARLRELEAAGVVEVIVLQEEEK